MWSAGSTALAGTGTARSSSASPSRCCASAPRCCARSTRGVFFYRKPVMSGASGCWSSTTRRSPARCCGEILRAAPDIEVVGIARDGLEALEKIAELKPDVVTLDLVMPNLDGLGRAAGAAAPAGGPRVVVVSISDDDSALGVEALRSSAPSTWCRSRPRSPPIASTSSAASWSPRWWARRGRGSRSSPRRPRGRGSRRRAPKIERGGDRGLHRRAAGDRTRSSRRCRRISRCRSSSSCTCRRSTPIRSRAASTPRRG